MTGYFSGLLGLLRELAVEFVEGDPFCEAVVVGLRGLAVLEETEE